MMENVLERAAKLSDQAEVYAIDEERTALTLEDARLKDIDSSIQSGIALRIIRDGKLGFAYTKNLMATEALLQNAQDSLTGGAEAPQDFPTNKGMPSLKTFEPVVTSVTSTMIGEECRRVCDYLGGIADGQLNLEAGKTVKQIRLRNSQGTDLQVRLSAYHMAPSLLYPGSYAAISRVFLRRSFEETPEEILDYTSRLFEAGKKAVTPAGGRMQVLFLPETLYVLMWRLTSAASGMMLYQRESPLEGKIGEKIFDEKLTIRDDPLNDNYAGARAFDDEGTPCRPLALVEKGVFRSFFSDLYYGMRLRTGSTGHGYRCARWGGETVSIKPTPSLQHLVVEPGGTPLEEMIGSVDRGVILCQALGAHSGNIVNGDYSVGLSPGLYVEHGEIVGHVKDGMVAGNIYETLRNVVSIERTQHHASGGRFPALLVDDVSVAIK
jgi:PmbA protein